MVLDVEDLKLRELALIENIQRDDLNVIELAYSFAQLINEHRITHEELATRISKSRSSITNTLRLLQSSHYVQELLAKNKISAGHAKIMLNLNDEEQKIVADTIIGQKLSVRETENLVKNLKNETKPKKLKKTLKNDFNYEPLNGFINNLKDNNLKAKFDKNTLKIELKSQADIERLSALLNIDL
ncbi:MAG: putative chromosome-partitioning protein ParB [Arcobacter lacus]|nr:MAG: putative chromosome-partitioning protein ParB [Arcobacter lacus]